MISLETSAIQARREDAEAIARSVAQFQAAGGVIKVGEPFEFKPKPAGFTNTEAPAAKPFQRRGARGHVDPEANARFQYLQAFAKARLEFAEKVRGMALTMSQKEIANALGVSRRKLFDISKAYGFQFRCGRSASVAALKRSVVDEAQDARNAERIMAFKELGLTRNQARTKVGIAHAAFVRILETFDIDYPKVPRGKAECDE